MGYSRENWHSGLTYVRVCEHCQTQITYMDDKLDFRPWYPDGFIYCPTCNSPLRHNENYAINKPAQTIAVDMRSAAQQHMPPRAAFCSHCGRAFGTRDNFCAACGSKR